jgi:hypothetical protein
MKRFFFNFKFNSKFDFNLHRCLLEFKLGERSVTAVVGFIYNTHKRGVAEVLLLRGVVIDKFVHLPVVSRERLPAEKRG